MESQDKAKDTQVLQEGGEGYAVWEKVEEIEGQFRSSDMKEPIDLDKVEDGAEIQHAIVEQPQISMGSSSEGKKEKDEDDKHVQEVPAVVEEQEQEQHEHEEEAKIFDFPKDQVESLVAHGVFQPRPLGGQGVCERYALLGDRVFNLFICEALLEQEPRNSAHERPEAWVKRLAGVYQAPSILVGLADELKLTSMIRLILGDADLVLGSSVKVTIVKAMIGSTYRVQGEGRARRTVRNIMKYVDSELLKRQEASRSGPVVASLAAGEVAPVGKGMSATGLGGGALKVDSESPSTRFGVRVRPAVIVLKEWFHRRNLPSPVFDAKYVHGPPHKPEFACTITYVAAERRAGGGMVPIGQESVQGARRSSKKAAMESAAISVLQMLDVPPEIWGEAALLDTQSAEQMHLPGDVDFRTSKRRNFDGGEGEQMQEWVFKEPNVQ